VQFDFPRRAQAALPEVRATLRAVMGRSVRLFLFGAAVYACSSDDAPPLFDGDDGSGGLAGTGSGGISAGSPSFAGAAGLAGAGVAGSSAQGGRAGANAGVSGPMAGEAGASAGAGGVNEGGAGGQGTSLECGATPCGGDPVGMWKATDLCVPPNFELPGSELEGCDPTVEDLMTDVTGSLMFRENGSYEVDSRYTFDFRTRYGLACFGSLAATPAAACALIEALVEQQGGSAECTELPDGCECGVSLTQTEQRSGGYEVSGRVIALDGVTYDFCASGDSLVLTESDSPVSGLYTK